MYTVKLSVRYVGIIEGESKEDTKQKCKAILAEMTKAVRPYNKGEKDFCLDVEKVEDGTKTGDIDDNSH